MPVARKKTPLKLRTSEITLENLPTTLIDIIGDLPQTAYNKELELSISLFDCDDDEVHPILSTEELFQEDHSMVYELRLSTDAIGGLKKKITKWKTIGIIPQTVLVPPYGGERKIKAIVRLVDIAYDPVIEKGQVVENFEGVLWTGEIDLDPMILDWGYVYIEKQKRRTQSIILKVAMAVAMADGSLSALERKIIKSRVHHWRDNAKNRCDGMTDQKRKTAYQGMMRRAVQRARAKKLNMTALIKSLRYMASPHEWSDTLDLCLEVITCNGIADNNQFIALNDIAHYSALEPTVFENIRDYLIMHLDITKIVESESYEFLGLDRNWDLVTTRKHLRSEYKKWNSRLNTVPDGKSRDNTQAILDMIGKAYKKYTQPNPVKKPVALSEKTQPIPQPPSESFFDQAQLKLFNDSE